MAFSNVAYDNAANKVAVASSGGIEFLVDLLNAHRSHAGVVVAEAIVGCPFSLPSALIKH